MFIDIPQRNKLEFQIFSNIYFMPNTIVEMPMVWRLQIEVVLLPPSNYFTKQKLIFQIWCIVLSHLDVCLMIMDSYEKIIRSN